ncbi:MAG: ATPase, T2SS/T4P/T4SS family [Egibacteraceae bacterium]
MSPQPQTSEESRPRPRRRRLGEVLLDAGVITQSQLDHALGERLMQDGRRERLGAVIKRLGYATDEDVARALATQLRVEHAAGTDLELDPSATSAVPAQIAERHGVVPVRWEGDELVVACDDPTDVVAVDDVKIAAGARTVRLVVVTPHELTELRQRAYDFEHRAGELLETGEEEADEEEPLATAAITDNAPIVRLAQRLLTDAIDGGASDVHVEPGGEGTDVRFRVDGVLQHITTVPKAMSNALVSRLKILANMDIAERRLPQDGRMRMKRPSGDVDVRASTLPSVFGETMVLRLLRKGDEQLLIGDVGFDETQRRRALEAIARPQGLVLISGPTGSGKTSTLYAFLREIAEETRNIITLEDPVEYQLDGVNQTSINERIGLTFPRSLRTVLRQDPDVVMVGEIRDPETAELALQASLTGHLVFSTLHTNDAPSTVVRLRDLGVPSYLVSSSLSLVIAQRLVRRLCSHCARPAEPTEQELAELGVAHQDGATYLVPVGCAACGRTGYRGRTGLFEVLEIDDAVRELIGSGGSEAAIRRAGGNTGLRSLREHGLAKARAGQTSLAEVLRVTPVDGSAEGACPTCAQTVEEDFAFCPWCTTDLRPPACGTCGQELRFGWRACPTCGAPREEG